MYSRYSGYQPFVPMNNRLTRNEEGSAEPQRPSGPDGDGEQARFPLSEDTAAQNMPPEPFPAAQALPAAVAAAVSAPQKNILESLFGGGNNRGRRGGHGGGLGGLGNIGSLGGIADLLRSSGGGVTKLLKNFSINWDAGDILMVLILIFMSLESDDDEILVLLGLVLVMGL
ncbi:MAG: hypothetical protein LBI19_04115 [Oscillospiraceae bacterium]|jgi:hypothetical protein|nr:hypothetical protein [Oscillospiraceae bacterium]